MKKTSNTEIVFCRVDNRCKDINRICGYFQQTQNMGTKGWQQNESKKPGTEMNKNHKERMS